MTFCTHAFSVHLTDEEFHKWHPKCNFTSWDPRPTTIIIIIISWMFCISVCLNDVGGVCNSTRTSTQQLLCQWRREARIIKCILLSQIECQWKIYAREWSIVFFCFVSKNKSEIISKGKKNSWINTFSCMNNYHYKKYMFW